MHLDDITAVRLTELMQLCFSDQLAGPPENEADERTCSKIKKLTLLDLPLEMVRKIAGHLDCGSRAAFALASKPLLYTLGKKVIQLDRRSRLPLLQILEKDKIYPAMFLCSYCRSFHRPRLPEFMLEWGYIGYLPPGRLFINEDFLLRLCEKTNKWTWNLITYGMLASIMRSHRHGNLIYPASALDAEKFRGRRDKRGPWLSIDANFKIAIGHLILMTEVVLSPAVPRESAMDVVYALLGLSHDDLEVVNVCAHIRWRDIFPFLLPADPENVPSQMQSLTCFWTHPVVCDKEECGKLGSILKARRSCNTCYTEFKAERCDLEGSRHRALKLTSWKDLGAGTTHHSHQWTSHFHRPSRMRQPRLALYGIQSLFESNG